MAEPPRVNKFIPWVSIVIFVANVAMFGVEMARGADLMWGPRPDKMMQLGGNFGPITLDGEQWRLFTSMFLHYGIIHLAANMVMGLYQVGRGTEQAFGHVRFAVLYVVAGLGGSLASAVRGHAVSAGASGALFGLIGGFLAFILVNRKRLDPDGVRSTLRSLAFVIAINVWLGFQAQGIDQAAHIGGLVTGFVVGIALELRMTPSANRLVRAAIVGVLGLGAIGGASFALGKPTTARLAFDPGIDDFARVEAAVVDRWNQLMESHAPPEEQAKVLEQEIIPQWENGQVAYIAAGGDDQALLRRINERDAGWKLLLEGLRTHDAEKIEAGRQRIEDAKLR
jgi:rhomboid protease GluP